MVLPILVPNAATWQRIDALPEPAPRRPCHRWVGRSRRDGGPRCRSRSVPEFRVALIRHWAATAKRCAPPPLPPLVARARANAAGRDLLARCEALLRQLLRRRRRSLGISVGELTRIATGFDGGTLRAPATSVAAMAFLLASMHWCGCRHPASLLMAPLHPPTGLVRWLTGFAVHDQVDSGQLLLHRLAEEERRISGFAMRLIEQMAAMSTVRRGGIVLLPELINSVNFPSVEQSVIFTTVASYESTTCKRARHL